MLYSPHKIKGNNRPINFPEAAVPSEVQVQDPY